MKRPARPPVSTERAPEGGRDDFEWPPAAETLKACEFVSLDDSVAIASPQRVGPSPAHGGAEPRRVSTTPARSAGAGEELVWPPPVEDLEALEIGAACDPEAPTVIVPPPRARPRGPRIEAVLDRGTTAVPRTFTRPATHTAARTSAPPRRSSTLDRRPSAALQVTVLGLAVSSVAGLGIWAVGRTTPDDLLGTSRPGAPAPPVFRAGRRPAPPVVAIDETPIVVDVDPRPAQSAASVRTERPSVLPVDAADSPERQPGASTDAEPPAPALAAPAPSSTGFDPTLLPGQRLNPPGPPSATPDRPRP